MKLELTAKMRVGLWHHKHNRKIYNRMYDGFVEGLKAAKIPYTLNPDKPIDLLVCFTNNPEAQKRQLKALKKGIAVLTVSIGLFTTRGAVDLYNRDNLRECKDKGDYVLYWELLRNPDELLDFPLAEDPTRLNKLNDFGIKIPEKLEVRPGHILIPQQVRPEGSANCYMGDWKLWFSKKYQEIRELSSRQIHVSRHPNRSVDIDMKGFSGCVSTYKEPIGPILDRTAFTVGLSSKLWIDSLVRGIPFYTEDKRSPGYVLSQPLDRLCTGRVDQHNLRSWFESLAHTHWLESEIKTGEPIKYVERRLKS